MGNEHGRDQTNSQLNGFDPETIHTQPVITQDLSPTSGIQDGGDTLSGFLSSLQPLGGLTSVNDKAGRSSDLNTLKENMDTLNQKFNEQEKKFTEQEKKFTEQETKFNEQKTEFDNTNKRSIESLTIFVAMLTFISTGVNIMKDTSGILMIGILLAIAGVLIAFSSLIIYVNSLSSDPKSRNYWALGGFIVGLIMAIAFGICAALDGNSTDHSSNCSGETSCAQTQQEVVVKSE